MQYAKHKNARKIFHTIDTNPQNYLIIHYSCESFYDISSPQTPRITSIAVYDFATAQTVSFSIHKIAEKSKISLENIVSAYDELEKQMLKNFFKYAKDQKNYFWIHWNMRDINFGFQALEERYSILGGTPFKIPNDKKIDLARLLTDCYGAQYTEHPRMITLVNQNQITTKDYLDGKQEAEAFANQEYVKLHMSTLRKVDIFASIINRAIDNTLKVNSKWSDIYGFSIQGFFNFCKNTWWIQCIWTLLSIVFGVILEKLIDYIAQLQH